MTVGEFLARVTAQEMAEWQWVLEREAEYEKLVGDRVEPSVAYDLVYGRDE